MKPPEKRTETLYAYITKRNREFVKTLTEKMRKKTRSKISESEIVDKMLTSYRLEKKRRDAQRKPKSAYITE